MKTNPQIIKFLSFIMIGLVVGTMICNYQLSGRISSGQNGTHVVSQAMPEGNAPAVPAPAAVPLDPLPAEMPVASEAEVDIFEEIPKMPENAPDVLPDEIPFLPEAAPESAAPAPAAVTSMELPADIFDLLNDLPASPQPQEPSAADTLALSPPEIPENPENNGNLPDFLADSAPETASSAPTALPEFLEPEPARPAMETTYVHTRPPRPRRELSADDIYDSPWSDADAIPAGQVSQIASHVGSEIPNPLRPQAAAPQAPPAVVHVAVAPVAPAPAPVMAQVPPTVQPAAVSPQMGHGLPAGIPAVAAPAELPASLPSEIPVLPAEIPVAASHAAVPSNALASAALAHPTLPVDGMLPATLDDLPGVATVNGMSQAPPANEIVLKFRQTDIRRVIQRLQERTGLGIYTSIEVQGELTCDIQGNDVDEVLRRLLGATTFGYARDGGVVYIGRRSDIQDLPVSITERGGRRVTPQYISLDMCERFIREHLSPYGDCSRQNHEGRECLIVKDMELALLELDKMLELVDIAPVTRRLDAFVFERSSDDKKYLPMTKVADKAQVTIQEYVEGVELEVIKVDDSVAEANNADADAADDEKSKGESKNLIAALFNKDTDKDKKKKEDKKKTAEKKKTDTKKDNRKDKTNYRAYVLSHRIDSLLMALEDSADTELVCDRKGISRVIMPGARMTYPVALNFDEDQIHYAIGVTEKKEPPRKPELMLEDDDNRRLTLEVECRLAGAGPEIKGVEYGKPIVFSGPIQLNHALIFQGKMGDFPDETNFMKTVTKAKKNAEMIAVFVLREDEQQFPRTDLTNVAMKYLIAKCEQVGLDIARKGNSAETDEIAREFLAASKTIRKIRNAK